MLSYSPPKGGVQSLHRRSDLAVFVQQPIQADTGFIATPVLHFHERPLCEPVDRIRLLIVELELLSLFQMQSQTDEKYNQPIKYAHLLLLSPQIFPVLLSTKVSEP